MTACQTTAEPRRQRLASVVRIRPFAEADIPAVADLRRRSFQWTTHSSTVELAEYMRAMFFTGPWRDEALPSLVYQDGTGRPIGFLGVVARRMALHGTPIRVAVFTQLMVEPDHRGIAALALLREFVRGPQDLSLSDAATDVARRLWERVGGRTALLHSLYWTRALRPWRYAGSSLGAGPARRLGRAALRPVLALADGASTRLGRGAYRQHRPPAAALPLAARDMVDAWPAMTSRYPLAGQADEQTLDFVLRGAERKREFGTLQRVLVRHSDGAVLGWYAYYHRPGGVGQVVHWAARAGADGEILDHMFWHAWRLGVVALQGRAVPRLLRELHARRCALAADGPWTLVHSPRADVLAAIERGDALLSRLDGEFWMAF